ncbi:unnamed protein product [Larinioides sclopetarius]|uniref:Uncharacterized protein n=1 Tax=Larinioides sclopetarius TaxID=280406 RepID=A0AAV2C2U1_9ARAC
MYHLNSVLLKDKLLTLLRKLCQKIQFYIYTNQVLNSNSIPTLLN